MRSGALSLLMISALRDQEDCARLFRLSALWAEENKAEEKGCLALPSEFMFLGVEKEGGRRAARAQEFANASCSDYLPQAQDLMRALDAWSDQRGRERFALVRVWSAQRLNSGYGWKKKAEMEGWEMELCVADDAPAQGGSHVTGWNSFFMKKRDERARRFARLSHWGAEEKRLLAGKECAQLENELAGAQGSRGSQRV